MTKVAIAKPEGKRTVLSKAVGEAGRPLPEPIRVDLEIKFSANLKGVRIHTGPLGDEVAKSLDAEAVTLGQHIFFQTGKWKPETVEGMDLLVHETAHTLQTTGPTLNQPATSVSQPGDAVERSADAQASEAKAGKEKAAPQPIPEATAARRVAGIAPREKKTADPARTIEELGRALLLRTRADAHDRSGRIRNQLIRMEDNLRRDVLRWLENHMESHDWRSFVNLLAEEPPAGTEGTEDTQAKGEAKTKPTEGEGEAGTPEAEPVSADKDTAAEPGKEKTGKEGTAKEKADKEHPNAGKSAAEGAQGRQMSPEEAAVEDAAAEGKEGPQEADVAKPSIQAAGGEEASTAEAAGGEAGAATAAVPQQTQAADAPAISAAPAPAEEPAGGGGGATEAAEAPEAVSQPDEQASRTGESVGGRSDETSHTDAAPAGRYESGASETSDSAAERSAATAELTGSAATLESPANNDPEAGRFPETEAPTASGASSAASASGVTAETAGLETTESSSRDEAATASEPEPPAASEAPVTEPAAETPVSPEPEPTPAATTPISEPVAETPTPTPEPEPAAPEAAAGAEIAAPSQDSTSEPVPESSTATTEPAGAVEAAAVDSGTTAGRGAAPEVSGPAPAGGMEQAAPASVPPSVLGEFAGEPSEAEPPAAAGGGGGGGAAASAPPPPPEAAEDVIPAGNPGAAMQTIGSMKVGPASRAMGAAAATVSAKTNQQRTDLAKAPPTIERPTGAPQGAPGSTAGNVPMTPPGGAPKAVATVAGGAPVPIAPPTPAPQPGPSVSQAIASPKVTGTAEGKLSQADVDNIKNSVAAIPDTDPDLDQTVPPAPDLELTNDADPSLADKQQTALMDSAATNLEAGGVEAAAPMGEDHIYPKVEPGTITPDASGSCDCGGGQKSDAASVNGPKAGPERGIEAVAEEESGEEVRQTANNGAGEVAQSQIDQEQKEDTAHTESQKAVTTAIEDNARLQSDDRKNARKEVQDARNEWTKGQQDAVNTAQTDSDKAVTDAHGEIATKQAKADEEAKGHIDDGNEKIAKARADSEKKAKIAKIKAEDDDDDGGFFSWVASKVTSFFSALRDAIHDIFDAARKLVNDAIEAAQKLAHDVIDLARKAIVGLIEIAGKALALVADVLLAAFPTLRDKFRAVIEKAVNEAVDTVNKLADELEKGIKSLLNGLLTALNAILCFYETVLNAIVDKVATVVNGAISAARAIVAALKMFAGLVDDVVAVGPGQWIGNFADSVMDGMRNHLWMALKAAVKKWFNELVQSIIGMGKQLLDFLFKGGLSLRKIAGFVWQALVAALPGIIVEFLIEKLIKMIIPTVGLIAEIIQGLIAAWGTIQKIIAAFKLFYTFLKAVKDGNAGPQFASALAASAIVVLQFLANYLVARLGKAASGVTGKLKALAQKIMAFFKRVGKGAMKVVRKVGGVIIRSAKKVGGLAKRGIHAVGRVAGRAVKAIGRVTRRVLSKTKAGRAVLKTYDKAKKKIGELHEKFKQWREKRKENKKKNGAKRVDDALHEIPPILERSAVGGIRGILLPARLLVWKLKYRLSKLRIEKASPKFNLVAAASPDKTAPLGLMDLPDEFLRDIVREAVDKVMYSPAAEAAEARIAKQVEAHKAAQDGQDQSISIEHPSDMLGYNRYFAREETVPLKYPKKRDVNFLLRGGSATSSETGPRPFKNESVKNQIVGGSQANYPKFSERLAALAESRKVSPDKIHAEFDDFVRLGVLPPGGADQAHLFAEMQLLTTGREGIRSSNLATAEVAFGSDLVQAGRIKPSQLIDRDEGVTGYSMAPKNSNSKFEASETNRFQRTFLHERISFEVAQPGLGPPPLNATEAQVDEWQKKDLAAREAHERVSEDLTQRRRNIMNKETQQQWESTPLGEYQVRQRQERENALKAQEVAAEASKTQVKEGSPRKSPLDKSQTAEPRSRKRTPEQLQALREGRQRRKREIESRLSSAKPLRPPDVHFGGSENGPERRHAALSRQWLQLEEDEFFKLKGEKWEFTDLVHARAKLSDLVLKRLKKYYRTEDHQGPSDTADFDAKFAAWKDFD